MLHHVATRHVAPFVLAGGLLLTAACGDETSPSADTSSSASTEASASASPSVEPASGPTIDMTSISVRIPQGWRKSAVVATLNQTGDDPKRGNRVDVSNTPAFGDPGPLTEQAKKNIRLLKGDFTVKGSSITMLDPVTVADVPMYHYAFRGTDYAGEVYGAALPTERKVYIQFRWRNRAHTTEAERDEIKESMFATVDWKGFTP